MPDKNIGFMQKEDLLTKDEIYRIANLASNIGIKKIRITGGEPLAREDTVEIIKNIKSLKGIKEVCLTTNGIFLRSYLDKLIEVGIDVINISLDTLEEKKYRTITGGGDITAVLDSINKCVEKGVKVKLNTVIIKDFNEGEILDFIQFAEDKNIQIRFIEMMPLGAGKNFQTIAVDKIKEIIEEKIKLISYKSSANSNGPAVYYKSEEGKGTIGFISPISHTFCESCNRIRLTADGFLKQCLHFKKGEDLKKLMRQGVTDEKLINVIKKCCYLKPKHHSFQSENQYSEKRFMYQIGG
ncbi:molybdenum cofactor biosynthesis protein A [Clostridiales bacterium oral taxon 876 str. F0540]|nr:molybdenum cofactor biosynthesis protein A [Clostridiales bacterium oral taxon 876 str. F0540]